MIKKGKIWGRRIKMLMKNRHSVPPEASDETKYNYQNYRSEARGNPSPRNERDNPHTGKITLALPGISPAYTGRV